VFNGSQLRVNAESTQVKEKSKPIKDDGAERDPDDSVAEAEKTRGADVAVWDPNDYVAVEEIDTWHMACAERMIACARRVLTCASWIALV
jgi:hypothetical protein